MNAKKELIIAVGDSKVKFGRIMLFDKWDVEGSKYEIDLRFYNHSEYLMALDKLNIDYDSVYGGQQLFGSVVFEDGSWLKRGEYDGSEWWIHNKLPTLEEVMEE